MRHNRKVTHLGRTTSHKKALIRNLVISLFLHKAIKTTHAKAREARRFAEKMITYAKKGTLHHRRLAFKFLQNKEATKVLFDEIATASAQRSGGYTRIIKLGFRPGDGAPVSRLELVDLSPVEIVKKQAAAETKKESKSKEKKQSKSKSETSEKKAESEKTEA